MGLVIGIGASAGGIFAMRALLPDLPAQPNITYVLSQHLDPRHASNLGEILERVDSPLTVEIVKAGPRLQGNHIHVVPPDVVVPLERISEELARLLRAFY